MIYNLRCKYEIIMHDEFDFDGGPAEYCTVKLPNIKYTCAINYDDYYDKNDTDTDSDYDNDNNITPRIFDSLELKINNIAYTISNLEPITSVKYKKQVRINYPDDMEENILITGETTKIVYSNHVTTIDKNDYNYHIYF